MNTRNTKIWTITLVKKDVFFDIDILSLYYSEVSAGEAPAKADRIATETSSIAGRRIVTRMCEHRLGDIRRTLARFLGEEEASASDDRLSEGDWTIRLCISTEAEESTLGAITDACHDYLVAGGLADYYAQIGVNGNREALQARADADMVKLRELIYFRPMP